MNLKRPSKRGAWVCWIVTLVCCATTLWFGANVILAQAASGLLALFGSRSKGPGDEWLLVALAPSALAVVGNVWMLEGGTSRVPGVSPWWLVPSLLIALGTFGFGAYVCLDLLTHLISN